VSDFTDGTKADFTGRPKAEVRSVLLNARRSRSDVPAADAALRAALVALVTGRSTVAGYAPLAGEPGGEALPDALVAACARLLLPVLLTDRDLDWARYAGSLVPSSLGLRHPAGRRLGVAAIAEAEVVVVPALAVDRRGVRLGRGGGSYDRALARVGPGPLVVAVLYDGELVDALPTEPHDRSVDAVVTPSGLTRL
jgi:5-formyltetrahydrofolate cyclo-ligase